MVPRPLNRSHHPVINDCRGLFVYWRAALLGLFGDRSIASKLQLLCCYSRGKIDQKAVVQDSFSGYSSVMLIIFNNLSIQVIELLPALIDVICTRAEYIT
ncbi:uncharacterized protein MCYG_00945 [Microsporum canis CBS 113480]|uniref:Uncharacterized protein n=1 Tax=Arthroderma otae (strain ATCC MYA-4605 / CBS 113480) TaxID=554155 RepID=C5FE23_ARTOC|nr:uncharacterized protein MCYG_00945 [Microsporum canis CBS 113480]EEQ28057.1 predicted protein [Microsporum canis CBS 113480]